ncbi:hypothetical protein J3458_004268 [Metarhizium acridum]|uniref:uncharacterized protein n=1 Tax=Metarhizium acridum TaxID=92637 RepID=UPI001C6C0DA5|nr:hypothetical protein J3458_004268 [Metarhizium acridum]
MPFLDEELPCRLQWLTLREGSRRSEVKSGHTLTYMYTYAQSKVTHFVAASQPTCCVGSWLTDSTALAYPSGTGMHPSIGHTVLRTWTDLSDPEGCGPGGQARVMSD